MQRERLGPAVSVAGHVVVFAVLLAPWWLHAGDSISSFNGPRDNRLIPWVLAWVAHALSTSGANVFDAPIYFPSPRMLTGSEHFFALQAAFAPLYWLTGNAVLAANVVVLLSYPGAAIAMDRLLCACGLAPGAAWFGGFAFALGPLRVPGSVQPLQFMNLFLPLVGLASMRLRQAFGWRPLAGFGVVFAVGVFSSYYLAANLFVLAAVYGLLETFRPAPRRLRFATAWVATVAVTLVALAIVSRPYFERRDELGRAESARVVPPPVPPPAAPPSSTSGHNTVAWEYFGRLAVMWAGVVPTCLAGGGLPGIVARSPEIRRVARIGLGFAVLGVALALRAYEPVLPAPIRDALGFLRFPRRFLLLYGFGVSLLAATALATVRRADRRTYHILVALAVAATCWLQGSSLVSLPLDHVAGVSSDAATYRAVRDIAAREGRGSLLELPLADARGQDLQTDAMIGGTLHWLPLIDTRATSLRIAISCASASHGFPRRMRSTRSST
jgi:hypothetical protein